MDIKKNITLTIICGAALLSCQSEDLIQPQTKTKSEPIGFSRFYREIRSSATNQSPERFLGRGFNLLEHKIYEEQGFQRPILDANRMQTGRGWNPFGEFPAQNIEMDVVDTEIDYRNASPKIEATEDISTTYLRDSIGITLGYNKQFTVSVKYQKTSEHDMKVHSFRAFAYQLKSEAYLSPSSNDDYSKFLSKGFVRDLREMNGVDLIHRYGTHLITAYYIGAYSNLIITAVSDKFSKDEVMGLTASAFDGKLDATFARKVNENKSSLRVEYSQGGSDYVPPVDVISFREGFNPATINPIDRNAWLKMIRKDNNTFMSLPFNRNGMIAIPDLIENIPLKLKYICAIQHLANPRQKFTYVLCNPQNYAPLKFGDAPIYTRLNQFAASNAFQLFIGTNFPEEFTEKKISGEGADAFWQSGYEKNGLWTMRSAKTGKYLCTDLKMRTLEEDKAGKRYFLLNPIFPNDNYSDYAWNKMLIQ